MISKTNFSATDLTMEDNQKTEIRAELLPVEQKNDVSVAIVLLPNLAAELLGRFAVSCCECRP
jgi:hypothetical protein